MNSKCIGVLTLCCVAAIGSAQGFAYTSDNTNNLYRVNLSNASSILIGNMAANGALIESLGITPGGVLYAGSSAGDLFSVNTGNAVTNFIGNTQLGNIEGMDWDPVRGAMLVTDFATPSMWSLNLGNAGATLVVSATSSGTVRSLSVNSNPAGPLPYDVRLDAGGQGNSHGTFDSVGGALSLVGSPTRQILGIDRGLNGQLYGLDSVGDLYNINPTNGVLGLVGNTGGNRFYLSMATDPVPEPASLLALAAGAAMLAHRRKSARA